MKKIAASILLLIGLISLSLADRTSVRIQSGTTYRFVDESRPYVPTAGAVDAHDSFRGSISIQFERPGKRVPLHVQPGNSNDTCGHFTPLLCIYAKHGNDPTNFTGCFEVWPDQLVYDPFFKEWSEVFFTTRASVVAAPDIGSSNRPVGVSLMIDVPMDGDSMDPLWNPLGRTLWAWLFAQMQGNYEAMKLLLDANARFQSGTKVANLLYVGVDAIVGYYQFADPRTTDMVNATDRYREYIPVCKQNICMSKNLQILYFLHLLENMPNTTIDPNFFLDYSQYTEANPHGQICNITTDFDTKGAFDRLPQLTNYDVPTLCANIGADCPNNVADTGYVDANGNFSQAICEAFIGSLPTTKFGQLVLGNSGACRAWHEELARADKEHCLHCGMLPTYMGRGNPCMLF